MILLQNDHWRLWSAPEQGVQWMAAQVANGHHWHSVMPDCRPEKQAVCDAETGVAVGQSTTAPLNAASFYMIPYSNRIRDGQFTFNGQSWQLPNAERHAIHGVLRRAPWTVTRHDPTFMQCVADIRPEAQGTDSPVSWPWPMRAEIEQALFGATLSSTIRIQNQGDSPMPAGTGWHPYFVRRLLQDDPQLQLPVSGVFPDEDGDCLPDGAPVTLPDELDFQIMRTLDPAQRIDCCLSGLSGPCLIKWADAGITLSLNASEACRFLVLFNPDMPHFAVEPVTNANDGFNLDAQGIDGGTLVVQPGDSFVVKLDITVQVD